MTSTFSAHARSFARSCAVPSDDRAEPRTPPVGCARSACAVGEHDVDVLDQAHAAVLTARREVARVRRQVARREDGAAALTAAEARLAAALAQVDRLDGWEPPTPAAPADQREEQRDGHAPALSPAGDIDATIASVEALLARRDEVLAAIAALRPAGAMAPHTERRKTR